MTPIFLVAIAKPPALPYNLSAALFFVLAVFWGAKFDARKL
jgi:hypothetical protein